MSINGITPATINGIGTFGSSFTPEATLDDHDIYTVGQTFWIVFSGTNGYPLYWNLNDQGVTGTVATSVVRRK